LEEKHMPEKQVVERAKQDLREGKHGASSPQQAIAIGLSEARRAGIPLKPPKGGKTSTSTQQKAEHDYEKGQTEQQRHESSNSPRSRARSEALKREPKNTTSRAALSRHAKTTARRRKSTS
jgi:Family of unknown function (DUF6496)